MKNNEFPESIEIEPSNIAKQIIEIAEQTGQLLMGVFKGQLSTSYKNSDQFDPVTSADTAADDLIRKLLTEKFPGDLILSEENSDIPTDYSKRIWMVDPLDGTKDFIKGKDSFGIHIGLLEKGEIVFGLVFAPAQNRMFYAEKNKGSYEKKGDIFTRIHVNNTDSISDARLITRSPGPDMRPLDSAVELLLAKERIHDSGIKVCRIACGEVEAHLNTNYRASKWDTLAPQIILEEAGGIMTDIDGKPLNYEQSEQRWERSYIAANNIEILNQILETVKRTGL